MKTNIYQTIKRLTSCFRIPAILLILILSGPGEVHSQLLNGNYTINPSLPSSATNFGNIRSAVAWLTGVGSRTDGFGGSNSTPGVSGDVTFTIYRGPTGVYTEQIVILPFPNASNSRVTFDGLNKDSVKIRHTATNVDSKHTIKLQGADFITFQNLTIECASPVWGYGIHLAENLVSSASCDSIRIINCAFLMQNVTPSTYSPGEGIAGVIGSNPNDPYTLGNNCQGTLVENNYFYGGYFGVNIVGRANLFSSNSRITNNTIVNPYRSGVLLVYHNSPLIMKNSIRNLNGLNSSNVASGISVSYSSNAIRILNNKISGIMGGYGIFNFLNVGTSAQKILVANNMVKVGLGVNQVNGIYEYCNRFSEIIHNTFSVGGGHSNSSAINIYYLASGSYNNLRVVNNIFHNSNRGFALTGEGVDTANFVNGIVQINNNNYFTKGKYLFNLLNNVTNSLSQWATTMGGSNESNSIVTDPLFVAPDSLYTFNRLLNGAGLYFSYVTTDIDGKIRNNPTPDIGANEYDIADNNIGPISIEPEAPLTSGLNSVKVTIRNFGKNIITSAVVSYQVNGSSIFSVNWIGALAPGNTTQVTLPNYNFSAGNSVIKAFTSSPNGFQDAAVYNDTLIKSLCSCLAAGTYSVNPGAAAGPTNFTSLNSLASALKCGISGPITVEVFSGTYNEQVTINHIPGADLTKKVTITSKDQNPSSVIVTFNPSTPENNFVLNLSGAGYIVFDKITFSNSGSVYGTLVFFENSNIYEANNLTFQDCRFLGSTAPNILNSLSLIRNENQSDISNLTFKRNTFQNGSIAMFFVAQQYLSLYSTGLLIDSNSYLNNYYGGVFIKNFNAPVISKNTITSNSSGYNIGISLDHIVNNSKINGNRISLTGGITGIYIIKYNPNSETTYGHFTNNEIIITTATTNVRGLVLSNSSYTKFFNNSIYLTSNAPLAALAKALYTFNGSSTGQYHHNQFVNNLFRADRAAAAEYDGVNAAAAVAMIEKSDYNAYFSTFKVTKIWGTMYSANTAEFLSFRNKLYPGSDRSSLMGDPAMLSVPTNLEPNINGTHCWVLNGRGVALPEVAVDIKNNIRSTNVVTGGTDIGAYEFTPNVAPPDALVTGSIAYNSTLCYMIYSDTVATITWDAIGALPVSAKLKYYSGTWPNDTTNNNTITAKYMNSYWRPDFAGGSGYSYRATLYYDIALLGKVSNENNLIKTRKTIGVDGTWTAIPATVVDQNIKTMQVLGFSSFGEMTGTDRVNPLPVELISFTAVRKQSSSLLNWATSQEINSNYFEIQRSTNGSDFKPIGNVNSAGNSNDIIHYNYLDRDAMKLNSHTLYYRLKQVDFDGTSEYSKIVSVKFDSEDIFDFEKIYPNPFINQLSLKFIVPEDDAIEVAIYNLEGDLIYNDEYSAQKGSNFLQIKNLQNLKPGFYSIMLTFREERINYQIMKVK